MKQLWQILKLLKAKCSRPPKFPGNFPSMVRNSLDLKYISRDPCFCSACAVVANMAIVNLVISRPKRSVVPLSRRSTVHSAKLRKWQCSKTQNLMGRSAGRTLLRPLGSKCKDQEFIWIYMNFSKVQLNISNVCRNFSDCMQKIAESVRPVTHRTIRKALQEPLSLPRLHLPSDDCCGAVQFQLHLPSAQNLAPGVTAAREWMNVDCTYLYSQWYTNSKYYLHLCSLRSIIQVVNGNPPVGMLLTIQTRGIWEGD